MKTQLGHQIKSLREERGVSTTQLAKKGIHPNLPATIEKARKAYTIDSLVNYLEAIAPGEFELRVVERNRSEELVCAKCENGLIWSKDRLKARSCDCGK